ncbi:MAG: hypothetical protein NT004_04880, partial [Bacteroidetes bacterium]|nr:hypothetical protein [Bacteroidota bacterium]
STMLDVNSTSRGILFPRMTQAQIAAIPTPASGLVVFCTTDNKFYTYVASVSLWKEILYGNGTIAKFSCGAPIAVNHVAGAVAPVSKNVTYNTVTNIPGEPSKCWITSNLGADRQATAKDDATEASAGWYWQYNRKQGYKHDGSTRTPNTAWILPISENLDWQAANDPCTLELGSSWRLPTHFEWNNVNVGGGWTNWDGPWNSGLKLHAAGGLQYYDGSLISRGASANYWSGDQHSATHAWTLNFYSTGIILNNPDKSYAFPVRCLKNN